MVIRTRTPAPEDIAIPSHQVVEIATNLVAWLSAKVGLNRNDHVSRYEIIKEVENLLFTLDPYQLFVVEASFQSEQTAYLDIGIQPDQADAVFFIPAQFSVLP